MSCDRYSTPKVVERLVPITVSCVTEDLPVLFPENWIKFCVKDGVVVDDCEGAKEYVALDREGAINRISNKHAKDSWIMNTMAKCKNPPKTLVRPDK